MRIPGLIRSQKTGCEIHKQAKRFRPVIVQGQILLRIMNANEALTLASTIVGRLRRIDINVDHCPHAYISLHESQGLHNSADSEAVARKETRKHIL